MRKILMCLLICAALLTCVQARAADNGIQWQPFNLSGDTLWVDGNFCIGAGYDIATFHNGLYDIRASWVLPINGQTSHDAIGVGVGVNIVKLLQNAGVTWIPADFSSSLGAMMDIHQRNNGDIRLGGGLRLTILSVKF